MSSLREKRCGKGINFLLLALLVFVSFWLVDLVLLLEPYLFGFSMVVLSKWPIWLNIFHWCATCVLWAVAALGLAAIAKRKYNFDVLRQSQGKMEPRQWILCFALLLISVTISVIDWSGWKVAKEFQYQGWLKFIFQYLYYCVEIMLVLLIIMFGQKAGEVWLQREKIPWGGLLVGMIWGLIHILTKDSIQTGLISFCGGILYGIVYLLTKKDVRFTYPFFFLMFVLGIRCIFP